MSDKTIHCKICGKYVGVIRDAKLIKGLVFICPTCSSEYEPITPKDSYVGDLFHDMFYIKNKNDKCYK